MLTQHTITTLRTLKLAGMAQAFEEQLTQNPPRSRSRSRNASAY